MKTETEVTTIEATGKYWKKFTLIGGVVMAVSAGLLFYEIDRGQPLLIVSSALFIFGVVGEWWYG